MPLSAAPVRSVQFITTQGTRHVCKGDSRPAQALVPWPSSASCMLRNQQRSGSRLQQTLRAKVNLVHCGMYTQGATFQ